MGVFFFYYEICTILNTDSIKSQTFAFDYDGCFTLNIDLMANRAA